MGSGGDGEGENRPLGRDDFDSEAYVDSADRLERAMDTQIQVLEGIDSKAEHVTRLIALLLGILFSAISFVTQLRQPPFETPPFPTVVAFGIGVGSLLVSMGAAIITYLSSRYRIGLRPYAGFGTRSPASYSSRSPAASSNSRSAFLRSREPRADLVRRSRRLLRSVRVEVATLDRGDHDADRSGEPDAERLAGLPEGASSVTTTGSATPST